jgi:hypothetical protein
MLLIYILEYIYTTFIYNTVSFLIISLRRNTLFSYASKIFC